MRGCPTGGRVHAAAGRPRRPGCPPPLPAAPRSRTPQRSSRFPSRNGRGAAVRRPSPRPWAAARGSPPRPEPTGRRGHDPRAGTNRGDADGGGPTAAPDGGGPVAGHGRRADRLRDTPSEPGGARPCRPTRFPAGVVRDLAETLAASAQARTLLTAQHYEVVNAVASCDQVALEVTWSDTPASGFGHLPAGHVIRAHIAAFLEFRDGKIVAQRNYDCYEPFA
ncbi:nuclear transport factor 2 family protein [Streptomyces collinus]|uniref:nuclear transport factor 2 family protein n=1 Tax=Streptomyces collinus TaxID=42684 RepID=UPI0037B6164D